MQTYLVVADGQSQESLAPNEDLVVLEKGLYLVQTRQTRSVDRGYRTVMVTGAG